MINLRKGSCGVAAGLVLAMASSASANQVELTNAPLFVSSTADPNVLFILDDSGSMRWGFMPDELDGGNDFGDLDCDDDGVYSYIGESFRICDVEGAKYLASNATNDVYYDPDTDYQPPLKPDGDGTAFPDAVYNDAKVDGFADESETLDLSDRYAAIMDPYFYKGGWGFLLGNGTESTGYVDEAFYYEFEGGSGCDQLRPPDSCFGERQHPETDEEKQNFANWFSYYRTRLLASKSGITEAFMGQPEDMRVGYDVINNLDNATGSVERGVRPFSDNATIDGDPYEDDSGASSFRTDFFEWLQAADAPGGTPLRRALRGAGRYFEESSDTGPWSTYPGVSDDESVEDFIECRQSISILMTDGYWTGSSPGVGNSDDSSGEMVALPGGGEVQSYDPDPPFSDDYSNTLADVAMEFWKRDLQPDMANRVPTIDEEEDGTLNPAFWQHMSTYGVGLGVSGSIDPDDAFAAIEDGDSIDWPDPTDSDPAKIDDLLHAGVNSRGGFFSASDPGEFSEELSSLLAGFLEETGASTGVTFDTATLEEDSLIFAAQFDSADWTGDLFASPLLTDNDDDSQPPEIGAQVWSAASILDSRNLETSPRQIITSNGQQGIPFAWSEITDTQKDDLRSGIGSEEELDQLAEDRVAYLRGDRSLEDNEGDFRERGSRLGDIVNSTPVRVSSPASGWPDAEDFGEDDNRYSDFRGEQNDRTPVIYTGANDGMLHGFKATEDGGEELLAFMPSAIFSDEPASGLHYLTSPGYSHKYYVDLPPLVADAFIEGRNGDGTVDTDADWRTVLLGGSRTGERAIFALDVTNPDRFDESNAGELMLWEFTAEVDDRMGYITEPPVIALAEWDNNEPRWTAFFGNGYNSPEKATGIFMLDLEGGLDGDWEEWDGNSGDYQFIKFRDETDDDVTGLSPVAVYDESGDRIVDRVYGGDRDGNIWVAEASNQGFRSAYRQGQDAEPLFTAEVGDEPQPITAAPLVIPNVDQQPSGGDPDLYVLFGTGQYLNQADLGNEQVQSLYAVRDIGNSEVSRGDLAARELSEVQDFQGTGSDVLFSDEDQNDLNDGNGWYVDLFEDGERITLSPQVRGEFIFATSSIPSDNPCVAGGASRNMAFGLDGLTPEIPVFTAFGEAVVSYKTEDGIASESAFLGDYRFTPTSTGDVGIEEVDTGAPNDLMGRQGWQELIE